MPVRQGSRRMPPRCIHGNAGDNTDDPGATIRDDPWCDPWKCKRALKDLTQFLDELMNKKCIIMPANRFTVHHINDVYWLIPYQRPIVVFFLTFQNMSEYHQ